jgi:lipopolysaccharide/colanic/teichoic acid biosynthesis glycosyltransferase
MAVDIRKTQIKRTDFPGRGIPRFVEVTLSGGGLLVCLPVLLLAALAIKLSSKGPVLFQQKRVGYERKLFTLYKLRTMKMVNQGVQVTASDDKRMTSVGRLLRKTKIDELPELWNILRGDMALVGPRPEVPRYVDLTHPAWQQVLQARPGLTDPVTLKLRNEEELLAAVKGDREEFYLKTLQPYKLKGYLDYLHKRSGWSDVKILFDTFLAVLFSHRTPAPTIHEVISQGLEF